MARRRGRSAALWFVVMTVLLAYAGAHWAGVAAPHSPDSPDDAAASRSPTSCMIVADDLDKKLLRWMPQTRRLVGDAGRDLRPLLRRAVHLLHVAGEHPVRRVHPQPRRARQPLPGRGLLPVARGAGVAGAADLAGGQRLRQCPARQVPQRVPLPRRLRRHRRGEDRARGVRPAGVALVVQSGRRDAVPADRHGPQRQRRGRRHTPLRVPRPADGRPAARPGRRPGRDEPARGRQVRLLRVVLTALAVRRSGASTTTTSTTCATRGPRPSTRTTSATSTA